ncbi:MAG: hypothetical protein ACYC61_02530 [Isosphaeraceae bacterium]
MISTNDVANASRGTEQVPTELIELKERIQGQPAAVRAELEPLIDEVMEHAMFRHRVMMIARDALERFRLDLESVRFDRDVLRRERAAL